MSITPYNIEGVYRWGGYSEITDTSTEYIKYVEECSIHGHNIDITAKKDISRIKRLLRHRSRIQKFIIPIDNNYYLGYANDIIRKRDLIITERKKLEVSITNVVDFNLEQEDIDYIIDSIDDNDKDIFLRSMLIKKEKPSPIIKKDRILNKVFGYIKRIYYICSVGFKQF